MKEKLEKVLAKLENIKYGYIDNNHNIYPDDINDWDTNFNKLYKLQSPEELINNKYGVCWDQVELERYYLEQENIEGISYFIIAHENRQEPTHTFLVIKDIKYYWLEHAWEPYRGLHEYETLEELILDVKYKFEQTIKKNNITNYQIDIYEYKKPKYNLGCIEFINYCEKGKLLQI